VALPSPTNTRSPAGPSHLTILVEKVSAPSLQNNLLHEPLEQAVQVYLPPSYEQSSAHYPVVYFLPGFGSDSTGNNAYFRAGQTAARMTSGEIQEMILVVPNGANVLHGSFYVNSPVTGNWEDFIVQDVVGYIDAHYRTYPRPEGRGIGGHSMGGFAALNLAMRHPDLFGAAFCLSPGFFDPDGLADSQMFGSENKPAGFLRRQKALAAMSPEDAIQEMATYQGGRGLTVAYGAAFAPDPEGGPPFFDYPYVEQNGRPVLRPEVWQRWENGFGGWPEKIETYHDALAGLRGIAIDYGTRDHLHWIPRGSEYVSSLLSAAGIPNELTSFDGGHSDQTVERVQAVVLPFFNRVLEAP
jgi:S-formylglutathione hydrolase FrmB